MNVFSIERIQTFSFSKTAKDKQLLSSYVAKSGKVFLNKRLHKFLLYI